MAVYICKCGFCFERKAAPDRCPDCGGLNIRFANDDEVEEYRKNRAEADRAYAQEVQARR